MPLVVPLDVDPVFSAFCAFPRSSFCCLSACFRRWVGCVFRIPQHHIKTEPEEESTPPVDPPQELKVAEKESAGAAKSDAETGEQPPEEAAAAGEAME